MEWKEEYAGQRTEEAFEKEAQEQTRVCQHLKEKNEEVEKLKEELEKAQKVIEELGKSVIGATQGRRWQHRKIGKARQKLPRTTIGDKVYNERDKLTSHIQKLENTNSKLKDALAKSGTDSYYQEVLNRLDPEYFPGNTNEMLQQFHITPSMLNGFGGPSLPTCYKIKGNGHQYTATENEWVAQTRHRVAIGISNILQTRSAWEAVHNGHVNGRELKGNP